jgi:hypothetical protein
VREATSVLPFVLDAFVQMDNCAGTNKSQFVFGGFALLLTLRLLDVVRPRFMIAGHTKFGPDVVAQKIAEKYNKADVFNHAQLNERAAHHASVKAYDGTAMLRTYRACTPSLFGAVTHINSYRLFTLVRDDGLFDIGDGLTKSGTDAKDFPGSGMVFPEATIQAAINALKRRSAIRVLRSVRAGTFAGVGAGSGLFGARREQLVPDRIVRAYTVRLFVKVEEKGTHWMEIPNYTKVRESELTASVNAALSEIVPYAVSTHAKQQGAEVVGPRAAQIIEQYKKWVPSQFVPDEYDLGQGGASGRVGASVQTLLHLGPVQQTVPAATAAAAPPPVQMLVSQPLLAQRQPAPALAALSLVRAPPQPPVQAPVLLSAPAERTRWVLDRDLPILWGHVESAILNGSAQMRWRPIPPQNITAMPFAQKKELCRLMGWSLNGDAGTTSNGKIKRGLALLVKAGYRPGLAYEHRNVTRL